MSFSSTSRWSTSTSSHPAGSNKRQYNICATCLSDEKLQAFGEDIEELKIILKHLLVDFDLDGCLQLVPPENGIKLCDLCLKTLQDIYFFKQKALNSLSQLKYQWKYWFQGNQTEQNTSQSLPEDAIVVTPKVEIKADPDPLETPKLIVLNHTTPEANVSVYIKEERHINNDHTNSEKNSDAVYNSGSEYRNSSEVVKANSSNFNSGYESKLIIKENFKSNTIQNSGRPMICITPSLRVSSDSSRLPVKIETISSLHVGPSKLPVEVDTKPHVRRNNAAKGQSDTQMASNKPCSDTNSDSGAAESKRDPQYTIPWYITDITREQLVKIREDLLKDPCFVNAVYKCLYCAQTFESKDNWNYHEGHCHGKSKENAEFSCFVCGLRFDTLSLLSAHMRFHSAGHHTYQCPTCDYATKDTFFLNRHRCPNKGGDKVPPKDPTMKLATGRRQYYCPACDYVSYTFPVNRHYIRYHTTETAVKCDVCDKSLKNLASLKSHKDRHHSGKPRPEKMFCAPCLLPFYEMARYREHMMTFKHAPKDQVKISCDECPKKFHLQEVYEKHKRSHELIRSGTKPHKCTQCGLSYILKKTLVAHIRAKHTEREIKRDHICEVCAAAFTTATVLRKHMAKHSNERSYKCEYCGDTFKYSGTMYTHIKLKHKKKKTKPEDENKGTKKSARNRKRRKEKGNEHEQSEDTHEHEQIVGTKGHEQSMDSQSMESSVYKGNMESLEDFDQMQNSEKSMEV